MGASVTSRSVAVSRLRDPRAHEGREPRVNQDIPIGVLVAMVLIFVVVLLVGLGYAWRKGVLSWK